MMITEHPDALAHRLVAGDFEPSAMAETLTRMASRGETPGEVTAMVNAFRDAAIPVYTCHDAVLDLCGTGGAPFRTFNVSTTSSFVVASLGVPVAKHGNRSNRGPCGSADVLEALGANIALGPGAAGAILDEIGFTFLFAQVYHPAMRNAAPVRKQLRSRTVFNMLGPLLNPVRAKRRQLIGVYSADLLELLPPVLDAIGVEKALIVHGRPGMDEISVLDQTRVVEIDRGSVYKYVIDPRVMGMYHPCTAEVRDLPPAQAARATREVLSGVRGARRDMVVMNAACGLIAYGAADDLNVAIRKCERAIDSGKALAKLEEYISRSNAVTS